MKAYNMALSELDFHHKMETFVRFWGLKQLPSNNYSEKNTQISLALIVISVIFKSDRRILISMYLFMKLRL